jgi:hypothetical protein
MLPALNHTNSKSNTQIRKERPPSRDRSVAVGTVVYTVQLLPSTGNFVWPMHLPVRLFTM